MSIIEARVHYRLIRQIGRGAYSTVYEAIRFADQEAPEQKVALKIIDDCKDNSLQEELFNEAHNLLKLKSPYIIETLGVERISASSFALVLEYIDGFNLKQALPFIAPTERSLFAAHIGLGIIKGLQTAHHCGIIHGDLSPKNVLLSKNSENTKLADFGLSCALAKNNLRSDKGTPGYLSPQRIQNHGISTQDDRFALAVIVFETLTGYNPFLHIQNFDPQILDNEFFRKNHLWREFFAKAFSDGELEELEKILRSLFTGYDLRSWKKLIYEIERNRKKSSHTTTVALFAPQLGLKFRRKAFVLFLMAFMILIPLQHSQKTIFTYQPGFLTINADPWAMVSIDNEVIGSTPLAGYKLQPGIHDIVLEFSHFRDRFSVFIYPRRKIEVRRQASFKRKKLAQGFLRDTR